MEIDLRGVPIPAMRAILLDAWCERDPADINREAARTSASVTPVVGIAHTPIPEKLTCLTEATTFTLVSHESDENRRPTVAVSDPWTAYDAVADAVARNPQASLALTQLVRQTESLATGPALAAEAATYSMLLAGQEFNRWRAGHPRHPPCPEQDRSIVADREGNRLQIRLSRPHRRNALTFQMREELYEALELVSLDPSIGQVQITGEGPAFCSGGDLDEFGTARDVVAAYTVRLARAPWRLMAGLRERVEVRVQGASVGAGAEIAAFAGQLSAAHGSTFRLPEVSMGLVPGAGGSLSVVRRIGRWRAAWMMLTGATVGTEVASRWGLVDEVRAGG